MTDNKNTILAIVLSAIVLIGWQYLLRHAAGESADRRNWPQQQAQKHGSRASRRQTGSQRADAQPGRSAAARASRPRSPRSRSPATRRWQRSPRVPIADRQPAGLDRAQRRTHRRSGAGQIPRNGRSEVAADRSAVAVRQPAIRSTPSSAGPAQPAPTSRLPDVDTVWTQAGSGALSVEPSGDADLGQRRGPRIPPHHRGRRQISVHDQGRGGEQERGTGHALSLRADLAPRHAADARLLHPARRPDRRARRQGLQEYTYKKIEEKKDVDLRRHQWLARHHRQILGGGAAARHRTRISRRISRPARSARSKPTRPTICSTPQTIAPGATGSADARLFAGAKEVARRQRL